MHELSIALSIVDGALEEAARLNAAQVEAVHVRIGRMSGVNKDALLFSYGIACEDTPLAHSQLVIEEVEAVIHCPVCQAERVASSFPLLLCPQCGSSADRVVQGQELQIVGMEMLQ
jgi:hydrogenase nickel incorporation protein HypA/HybF